MAWEYVPPVSDGAPQGEAPSLTTLEAPQRIRSGLGVVPQSYEVPPEADELYGRVRKAEGTANGDGYLYYGGEAFTPGKEHPGAAARRPAPGGRVTHAAGPGQWLETTWVGLKPDFRAKFGRDPDFSSDADQKRMVWLNAEKVYGSNLAADIAAGKLDTAKLIPQWEGFKRGGGWDVTETGKWKVDPRAISYEQGRSGTSVVWMPPGDYLEMLPEGGDRKRSRSLREALGMGSSVEALPSMEVRKGKDGRYQIFDQDGRGRAEVAREEGVTLIPVAVRGATEIPDWIDDAHGNQRRFGYQQVAKAPQPAPTWDERVGTGARDILGGAAQLAARLTPAPIERAINQFNNILSDAGLPVARLPEGGVDQAERERLRQIEAERVARGEKGVDWWREGGRVAATLPLATAAAPATLGQAILGGAAVGAGSAALTPIDRDDYWRAKAGDVALGAGVGAGAGAAARGIAQAVAPQFRAQVGKLLGEDVRLTPGQMAGGTLRRTEDALASIPVVGQAIRSGQRKSIEDFNRAAWNRVLAPLGEKLPKGVTIGREAAQYADDAIERAYDKVIPNLVGQADAPFMRELLALAQRAKADLPAGQRQRFAEIVNEQLIQKVSAPARGDQLKGIDSMLGATARGYRADPMHDNRVLGRLVGDLHDAFRSALYRQNPQHAAELKAANEAYANYVRVSRAASSTASTDGVFTPTQLQVAVRQSDPSLRKMDFGKGEALLQDLSDAAKSVLPRVVPDSGTPERLMTERALGLAGIGGAAAFEPGALAAGLTAAAPYTGPGMNMLRVWATSMPKVRNMMAQPIRDAAPIISGGAGALASRPAPAQGWP